MMCRFFREQTTYLKQSERRFRNSLGRNQDRGEFKWNSDLEALFGRVVRVPGVSNCDAVISVDFVLDQDLVSGAGAFSPGTRWVSRA